MMKTFLVLMFLPAILGVMLGWLSRAPVAHACHCAPPSWELALESVQSSDPSVDHTKHWPASAQISGGPDSFFLESSENADSTTISNLDLDPAQ